jgi:hypothetical protein
VLSEAFAVLLAMVFSTVAEPFETRLDLRQLTSAGTLSSCRLSSGFLVKSIHPQPSDRRNERMIDFSSIEDSAGD